MLIRRVWLLVLVLVISGCGAATNNQASPLITSETTADLSALKTYLVGKTNELSRHTTVLQAAANRYYDLAKAADFDYTALSNSEEARKALNEARTAYRQANPAYETMEGIVGGVPTLAQYDIDLDAGSSAEEDAANAVSFDVQLPDGSVLKQPGNFFYLLEASLWGTNPTWSKGELDLDTNGSIEFGEVLPDANILKGLADSFVTQTTALQASASAWNPTMDEAFTALIVMTPTMDELFGAWKDSRSVSGEAAASDQFVASSRLQDIVDILSSLQVIYQNVEPVAMQADSIQAEQIDNSLNSLHSYVDNLRQQEAGGTQFTPEQADLLGNEAQERANTITGQLSQIAAKLDLEIAE